MRDAEAKKLDTAEEVRIETLLDEIRRLHLTLPIEGFFHTLEEMIDRSRKNLESVQDPARRERLREQYATMVNFAMDLAMGHE